MGALVVARTGAVAQESSPAASPAAVTDGMQPDGTWTFTDDRDRIVQLPAVPERIFADLQAGLSLWDFGFKSIGFLGYAGSYQLGDEHAGVPFLNLDETGGEIDVEAVIGLAPDLSVGMTWDTANKNDFGGVDEGMIESFVAVAPTVCIAAVAISAGTSIERFGELAETLGADVAATAIADAKSAYEAAAEAVRQATAAKPGLRVMALSPGVDTVYVGNPKVMSDLLLFTELGVEFVQGEGLYPNDTDFFPELSWEQVGAFQADLYLRDSRAYSLTEEELLAQPTFSLLPAASAGQITDWAAEYVTSYQGMTPILEALAEAIDASEIVTG